ncbi:DUF4238 domain-containing protein [Pseudomonas gingeri]|uniref:DUF4238 domain-containing protein n=1 Tax=Pseudomonas gingeri TaxID=117681 RepID=UPI0015A1A045|nr:DUF4238 domain-containing protein [Pseudomonas gingeri]NWE46863.1 DUF4238 domain-containing protein [Pseudomonas gingeri]
MSGKRHHFVPRFLQKSFSHRRSGNEYYCWVFKKSIPSYEANIKNIGLERFFYSIDTETELDDKITKKEELELFPIIDRLRADLITESDTPRIAEMLTHFETRAKHFRSNATASFAGILSEFDRVFSNESSLYPFLKEVLSLRSPFFQKALNDAGLNLNLVSALFESQPELLDRATRDIAKNISGKILKERESTRENLIRSAKSGHLQSLANEISSSARTDRYKELNFSIINHPNESLILGDSILLFEIDGTRKFTPFLDKKDKLISVILPLSSKKYLAGHYGNSFKEPENLNLEIASCSLDYFISGLNDASTQSLQDEIGKNAHWVTEKQVSEIFHDCMVSAINFDKDI